MSEYLKRYKLGVFWSTFTQGYQYGMDLVSLVIVARILAPRHFGLVSMAAVVSGIIRLLGNIGISSFLVYKKDVKEYANAAFWLNLTVGVALASLQIALSYFIALFYKEPIVMYIMMVTAVGYFVSALGSVHHTLLFKEVQIKVIKIREILIATLSVAAKIIMALSGFGLWSLVLPSLIMQPIRIAYNWHYTDFRPKLRLDIKRWKEIFSFGKNILGLELLDYLSVAISLLIVGRFLGAAALGIYEMAFTKALMVGVLIYNIIGKNSFPLLSKYQTNRPKLNYIFYRISGITYLIMLPISIGQIIVAHEFIYLLLGEKWIGVIKPFQIFTVYAVSRVILSPFGQLLKVLGRPDVQFKMKLIEFPLLLSFLLVGAQYGIVAVSLIVSLTLGIIYLGYLSFVVLRITGIRRTEFLRILRPSLYISLLLLTLLPIKQALVGLGSHPALVLSVVFFIGCIIYIIGLRLFSPTSYLSAKKELHKFIVKHRILHISLYKFNLIHQRPKERFGSSRYWDILLSRPKAGENFLLEDKWKEERMWLYREVIKRIPCHREEAFNLLEIGCAYGLGLEYIRRHFPNAKFSGCDISRIAIEKCKQRFPYFQCFTHDIRSSPLPQSYDIIIILETLEHLPKPLDAVRNILKFSNKAIIATAPYREDLSREHVFIFNKNTLAPLGFNASIVQHPVLKDTQCLLFFRKEIKF